MDRVYGSVVGSVHKKVPVTTKRRTQSQRRNQSTKIILDTAEREFALLGYDSATLVSVAAAASVDPALMRYYFVDKHTLFEAVVRRRAPELNALRLKAMAIWDTGGSGSLEELISAFVAPGLELSANDEAWRNYDAIIAFLNSSRGRFEELMSEVFDEVSKTFLGHLRNLFPHTREELLYWSYHYLSGGLTFSLGQTGRIDRMSSGLVRSDDFRSIARMLPILYAAGITALCNSAE